MYCRPDVVASVRPAVVLPRLRSSVVETLVTWRCEVDAADVVRPPPRSPVVEAACVRASVDVPPPRPSAVVVVVVLASTVVDGRNSVVEVVSKRFVVVGSVVVPSHTLHTRVPPLTSTLSFELMLKLRFWHIFKCSRVQASHTTTASKRAEEEMRIAAGRQSGDAAAHNVPHSGP